MYLRKTLFDYLPICSSIWYHVDEYGISNIVDIIKTGYPITSLNDYLYTINDDNITIIKDSVTYVFDVIKINDKHEKIITCGDNDYFLIGYADVIPMDDNHSISICTTSMNRYDDIIYTLPKNLEVIKKYKNAEIVLLNYDSKDNLHSHIINKFKKEIESGVLKYYYVKNKIYFRHSHAKNIAHRLSTKDIVISIDSDNLIDENFVNLVSHKLNKDRGCIVHDHIISCGRIAMSAFNFYRIGGYDESMSGWGTEDVDLIERGKLIGMKYDVIRAKLKNNYNFITSNTNRSKNTGIDISVSYENNTDKHLSNIRNFNINPNNYNWGVDVVYDHNDNIIDYNTRFKYFLNRTEPIRVKPTGHWGNLTDYDEYNSLKSFGEYKNIVPVYDNYDVIFVSNTSKINLTYSPDKTIVTSWEPDCLWKTFGLEKEIKTFRNKFSYLFNGTLKNSFNFSVRLVNVNNAVISKDKCLSAVISNKAFLEGHVNRLNCLEKLDQLDIDIYGTMFNKDGSSYTSDTFTINESVIKNYKGRIQNKSDALFPYKYHFNCENSYEKNYFTEKILDAIYSECLCFYDGCPNLEEYIDPRAFIRINSKNPQETLHIIKESILNNEWENRIDIIRSEKKRLLEKYNVNKLIHDIVYCDLQKEIHFNAIKKRSEKNKNLIYTIAIGEQYIKLTNILVSSLRKQGNFLGDIVVFTNTDTAINGAIVKTFIPNGLAVEQRIFVHDMIDTNLYDQILYLDCDMICTKPLDDLFCAKDCIRFLEIDDIGPNYSSVTSTHTHLFMLYFNYLDMLMNYKRKPITNGVFCMDARIFHAFMEYWKSILLTINNRKFGCDQAAFNTAIRRSRYDAKPFDKLYVSHYDNNEDFILFHPAGEFNYKLERLKYTELRITNSSLIDGESISFTKNKYDLIYDEKVLGTLEYDGDKFLYNGSFLSVKYNKNYSVLCEHGQYETMIINRFANNIYYGFSIKSTREIKLVIVK